jgi:hypothetical protein
MCDRSGAWCEPPPTCSPEAAADGQDPPAEITNPGGKPLGLYPSERFGERRPPPSVTLGRVRTLRAVEESAHERQWWRSALAGSGEAFAQVFDLHRDRLYRHALSLDPPTNHLARHRID